MNRNTKIAAAVAAVLGTLGGAGSALAQPTLAQAQAPGVKLYIAGSSAAKNAVVGALQAELCGGASNALTFSSVGDTNFFAISCIPANGVGGGDGNTVYDVFYRDEGGSVTGALPIVNGVNVNQLDLSLVTAAMCTTTTCSPTVSGATSTNGVDDSFGGDVQKEPVQLGIMDVEPGALIGNNYPTPYSTGAWGAVNPTGLQNLGNSASSLFDEVYGIFVNTGTNAVFTESGQPVSATNPLQLSQQTLQQLVTGSIKNWNLVTDVFGKPVTTTSLAVTIVNREQGSGSRAATDLLIGGDVCSLAGKSLVESTRGATDFFSTGNVLSAAASVAGAITYATIDNIGANATLTAVSINGVAPTNLNAATGAYPFWVEATIATNPNATPTGQAATLLSFITSTLQTEATAPHLLDVNAVPAHGNTASATLTANSTSIAGLGTVPIYVNPFTRNAVTCNLPAYVP